MGAARRTHRTRARQYPNLDAQYQRLPVDGAKTPALETAADRFPRDRLVGEVVLSRSLPGPYGNAAPRNLASRCAPLRCPRASGSGYDLQERMHPPAILALRFANVPALWG